MTRRCTTRFWVPFYALLWVLFSASWAFSASSDQADLQAGLQQVKSGEGALAFSSGFIRREPLPLDGMVSRITGDNLASGNRLLVGLGDVIYLKLANPEAAALGDYFTLYRRVQDVYHPRRGNYLGELYLIVGVVHVTQVSQDLATVRVIRSYGQITPGDGVMRFVPPPPPESAASGRRQPELPGMIVAIPPPRFLVAQAQVVYIDWGSKDGLVVGDRIDVHRTGSSLPIRKIGELKVLAVEDASATALIIRSTAPFLRGDHLVLQESGPQVAKAETITEELDRLSKAREQELPQAALSGPQDIERRLAELAKQLEFEQGSPSVTPASLPALKEISDLLKTVTDKQIRIEGHADDKPIGPSLKQQFPSNAQLSVARAVGITSYLVENGVNPSDLTSLGHADKKPVATNRTEEGRSQNRRIEIVLVPKPAAGLPHTPAVRPETEAAAPKASPAVPGPLPGLEEAPRVIPPAGAPVPPEKP